MPRLHGACTPHRGSAHLLEGGPQRGVLLDARRGDLQVAERRAGREGGEVRLRRHASAMQARLSGAQRAGPHAARPSARHLPDHSAGVAAGKEAVCAAAAGLGEEGGAHSRAPPSGRACSAATPAWSGTSPTASRRTQTLQVAQCARPRDRLTRQRDGRPAASTCSEAGQRPHGARSRRGAAVVPRTISCPAPYPMGPAKALTAWPSPSLALDILRVAQTSGLT